MENKSSEPLIDMVIPFPKYKHVEKATKDRVTKTGKFLKATERKEFQRLALVNTIHKWFRHQKTEVKNNYKEILKDFYIPDPIEQFRSGTITYIIHRHTKQKIDADSSIFCVKWFTDSLVETGHLVDDDDVIHILKPAVFVDGQAETQIRVIVHLSN